MEFLKDTKNEPAPREMDTKRMFLMPGLTESILKGVHFSGGKMNGNGDNPTYAYSFKLTAPVTDELLTANMGKFSIDTLELKKFADGFISRHFCISEENSFLVEVLVNNADMDMELSAYVLPLPYSWESRDYYRMLPADMDKGWQEQHKDPEDSEYKEIEENWNNSKAPAAKGIFI